MAFELDSLSGNENYPVIKCGSDWHCKCPDHILHEIDRKHSEAAKHLMKSLYESSTQPSKTLISPEQFYAFVAGFDRLEKLETPMSKS